jgi:hypothetical protein
MSVFKIWLSKCILFFYVTKFLHRFFCCTSIKLTLVLVIEKLKLALLKINIYL